MKKTSNQCPYCDAVGTHIFNGNYFCEKHILDIYRNFDKNKKCGEITKKLLEKGLKPGTFRWVFENIREIKKVIPNPKMSWATEFRNVPFWKVIRSMYVWYFLT